MSEWVSVLAVFWVLWALDGWRLPPRRMFTIVGRRIGRGRVTYQRFSMPGFSPASWRILASEVPIAFSPEGVCNRPTGGAGRPGERPTVVRAWRWQDVREVGVAGGWIYLNGVRFCPDTGHLRAREFLALAQWPVAGREARLRAVIARWFRPVQLQRRVRVLTARTRVATQLNVFLAFTMVILTIYVAGDGAARVPTRVSEALAAALPWVLLTLLVVHVTAVVLVWRVVRRLKPVAAEKRGTNLFSALMMPPQALRLRALAGDGFFPAQHPLAVMLAIAGARSLREAAFDVLADLRWPLSDPEDPPLVDGVAPWFRVALAAEIEPRLRRAGILPAELLTPPEPDAPASCTYCPRCRAQFVAGSAICPNGVPLQPLAAKAERPRR